MAAKFPIAVGDEVSLLNEVGGGVVLALLPRERVRLRTFDGFELVYPLDHVVKRAHRTAYPVSDHHARLVAANDRLHERIARDKGRGASVQNGGKAVKRVEDPQVMEIDLHLHKLVDNENGLSAGEKLSYQLEYFERMLNTAIREKKRKLIVIHGIGEGVLREEVRKALQYYDGVRFDDADPRRYGHGATEVELLLRH